MAGADSVEKLEDVIVRSAEQVAGQIRAEKDAISTVIFGQERVIENTLVTILSGGHALPVHARPAAVGYSRRRGFGREQHRQAVVPLHLGSGVRTAPDGRRNQ